MNLLLVDDEASLLQMLAQQLARHGHIVTPAASVGAARAALTTPFEAAVIDWTLPDGNGLDVARDFLAAYPSARVVFTSGYPLDHSVIPESFHDRVRFLQKPFLARALAAVLSEL
jgi:DNA-binding NtrC family response regulator